MAEEDIDLERIVYDPKYRKGVMERLNGELREAPGRDTYRVAPPVQEPDAAE